MISHVDYCLNIRRCDMKGERGQEIMHYILRKKLLSVFNGAFWTWKRDNLVSQWSTQVSIWTSAYIYDSFYIILLPVSVCTRISAEVLPVWLMIIAIWMLLRITMGLLIHFQTTPQDTTFRCFNRNYTWWSDIQTYELHILITLELMRFLSLSLSYVCDNISPFIWPDYL